MKNRKNLFHLIILISYFLFLYIYFSDIINSKNIILDLSFKQIDFSKEDPKLWIRLKKIFHISNLFIFLIFIIHFLKDYFSDLTNHNKNKINKNKVLMVKTEEKNINKLSNAEMKEYFKNKNKIKIFLGFNKNKEKIIIEDKALFQNILITGSIGSGKTQSCILPITRQLLSYKKDDKYLKVGGLILDVKGNFAESVEEICKKIGREKDVIKIELNGKYKYNPLYKPNLKPQVLANRLKTIMLLLSPENSEMYWIDKAEQLMSESIKFIRLYNQGYVNFVELSKIIFDEVYYFKMKEKIKLKLLNGIFSKEDIYNLNTFFDYYETEFLRLDQRTSSIIKSEISRITNIFISDYEVNKIFSPSKNEINFHGFKDALNQGKIIVLNMNVSENTLIAKIIASYLKLDFQGEVLNQLKNTKKNHRTSIFICDEYQEYITKTDANFYAQSREAKCINVVSTQSYTSLKNTLKDKESCEVIIQNLLNKIWFRNDDIYTVESAINQIGKIYKEKVSTTISENSKDSEYNYLLNKFISSDSNLSESINKSLNLENLYETKDFTQKLKTFEAITFLTNNNNQDINPEKIITIPEFKRKEINV